MKTVLPLDADPASKTYLRTFYLSSREHKWMLPSLSWSTCENTGSRTAPTDGPCPWNTDCMFSVWTWWFFSSWSFRTDHGIRTWVGRSCLLAHGTFASSYGCRSHRDSLLGVLAKELIHAAMHPFLCHSSSDLAVPCPMTWEVSLDCLTNHTLRAPWPHPTLHHWVYPLS